MNVLEQIEDWHLPLPRGQGDPHVNRCVLIAKLGLLWVSEWGLDGHKGFFYVRVKTQMLQGSQKPDRQASHHSPRVNCYQNKNLALTVPASLEYFF